MTVRLHARPTGAGTVRYSPLALAIALLAIFLLDLLVERRPPSLSALALTDEPAHLATALLFLAIVRPYVIRPFVLAALAAAVLIDLDHLPYVLGHIFVGHRIARDGLWPLHSVLTVVICWGLARFLRGIHRQIGLGVAFGVVTHLIRDLATGGTPLLWPLVTHRFTMPYSVYAMMLLMLLALICWRASVRRRTQASSPSETAAPGPQ